MDLEILTTPRMSFRAWYEITVVGQLAEYWADWINDITISLESNRKGKPYTTMRCLVRDQSQLFGILNQLNSLNLPLLQVTFIRNEGENHG
jgi:hypothetical protein